MAYATVADLKEYLGITTAEEDALLADLLAASQAAIDGYCRQTFEASADSTRYFDPTCDVRGRTLLLDAPLCAITSVTNGDGMALTSSHYVTEPRNGTPWWGLTLKQSAAVSWTYLTTPENAIAVVGRWAYSQSAPGAIVQATLEWAAALYNQRGTEGYRRLQLDDVSAVDLLNASSPHLLARLAPYRRLS